MNFVRFRPLPSNTSGGLWDVYDRGDYLEERRRALQLPADFLLSCEQPGEM